MNAQHIVHKDNKASIVIPNESNGGEPNLPVYNAKSRYEELASEREPYLQRARDMASLTLPYLFPPTEGDTSALPQPWQSLGGNGVKNLAAKLLLTILPPNEPSFKYQVDEGEMAQAGFDEESVADIKTSLTQIANRIGVSLESSNLRATITEALKQIEVGGNALLYAQDESVNRVYRLDSYVCRRDGTGDVTELIVKQMLKLSDFEGKAKDHVQKKMQALGTEENLLDEEIETFIHVKLVKGNKHVWHQEAFDSLVPGTESTSKLEETPWLALRWTAESGLPYGRSLCEEHQGDLETYDRLVAASRRWAGAASRFVLLVNPAGTTDAETLNSAEDGEFVEGREDELGAFSVGNLVNMSPVYDNIRDLKADLSKVFLMNTSIQRQGERVTAEEIRYMARELESAYGGIYSTLAQELQLPLIKRRIATLTKQKKIPKIDTGTAKPTVSTGLEAIGRGHEADKLDGFLADLGGLFGPQVVEQYIDVSKYMKRKAASLALDESGLVRTAEDVQEIKQQEQMNMAAQTAIPGAMNMAQEQMQQGQAV